MCVCLLRGWMCVCGSKQGRWLFRTFFRDTIVEFSAQYVSRTERRAVENKWCRLFKRKTRTHIRLSSFFLSGWQTLCVFRLIIVLKRELSVDWSLNVRDSFAASFDDPSRSFSSPLWSNDFNKLSLPPNCAATLWRFLVNQKLWSLRSSIFFLSYDSRSNRTRHNSGDPEIGRFKRFRRLVFA